LARFRQIKDSWTPKWSPGLIGIASPYFSQVTVSVNNDFRIKDFQSGPRNVNQLKTIFERIFEDPILLVNVDDGRNYELEYIPVALVRTSKRLRKNVSYCHRSTLWHKSRSHLPEQIMYDDIVVNRDNEYSVISFEEYKKHSLEFQIYEIALIRKDIPDLLRECKQSGDTNPDFLHAASVLRVCGADEKGIHVENLHLTWNGTKRTDYIWFVARKLEACLIVLSIAIETGFCPWHPHKDPCSASFRNDEVSVHCLIEFSLCGVIRYNGLVGNNGGKRHAKCIFIGCLHRACADGICNKCVTRNRIKIKIF